MRRRLVCALLPIGAIAGRAQAPGAAGPETTARVKWLAEQSHPVRTIDPEDDDFSDLRFLEDVIGDARVVQLGDQTHGDGATIYARSRLVRFLHSRLGFDVLVWESGFFNCEEMNEALQSDVPLPRVMQQGLHPISAQSGQLLPLFRYLRASLKTERPLRQTGLDVQDFLGEPTDAGASLRRLFSRIESLDAGSVAPEERTALQNILDTALKNQKPTPEQREQRRAMVTQLLRRVQARTNNSRSSVLVERALENALSLEELSSYDAKAAASEPPNRSLYRDRKMGETLSWLLNHYYAGKRLIVLVGGGHAAHRIGPLYAEAEKSAFIAYRTLGDHIHEELGRRVYTIQFATFEGQFGPPFRPARPLTKPAADSLEDLWHRTGRRYGFLDLRSVPAGHWLRQPVTARPFGYTEQKAIWPDHFDAFFYTDAMFPSTTDGTVPQGVKTAGANGI